MKTLIHHDIDQAPIVQTTTVDDDFKLNNEIALQLYYDWAAKNGYDCNHVDLDFITICAEEKCAHIDDSDADITCVLVII